METLTLKKGNKTIAKDIPVLKSDKAAWGLMFKKRGTALLTADWEGRWISSIHTFFCIPLLIAWINSKNKVVDVKKTKPWRFYVPKEPAKYVFETSKMNTKIKIGDKITLKY